MEYSIPAKPAYNGEVISIDFDKHSNGSGNSDLVVLDIEDGLFRLGGSYDFYIKLALFFRKQFKDIGAELKILLDKGSLDEARLLAHSLNGASANISALKVRHLAFNLEKSLVKEDQSAFYPVLGELVIALDEVFSAIDSLEKEAEPQGD